MKPYSKDLRLRVLAAVDAGTPREEVAKTFSVSICPPLSDALIFK
jgi:transposase